MELTFAASEKEARETFGSLVLTDVDRGPITLLSPVWIEDPATLDHVRECQQRLSELDQDQEAAELDKLEDMKRLIVDMLAWCADKPEMWREQAHSRPLPVLLHILRKWQEAAQPGEAWRSSS